MEQRSKTDPPIPPPMAGSTKDQKSRRTELVRLLGNEIVPALRRSDGRIDVATKTMLKPAWLAAFLNDVRTCDPPSCGWSVLMLERAECYNLYNEVINGKLEEVKERILIQDGTHTEANLQEMPKLAMLAHCRKQQIHHICENITDWERIEIDRIFRLNKLYTIDLTMRHGYFTPAHKPTIGGGKPLPQPFYVNPEDDPNYDPPGSTPASRLMNRMLRGDENEEDKFVPTDLETRQRGLALVAKEMEPFEHLSPEQLSDLVLRNCKKEYELAEAIYRRRMRGRIIEDHHEMQLMSDGGENVGMHTSTNIKGNNGHEKPDGRISGRIIHGLREEYVISPNILLTDSLVFLSMLEHLQWQFASAVEMPVESLVNVHNMGDSITNPRPPQLLFVDPRCQEANKYAREYSASFSDAWEHRCHLNAIDNDNVSSPSGGNVDTLLLFGDDPVFYLKDQEMLQHMIRHGVGLKIHSKVPGFTLPPEPTEHQKATIFYRLSSSQPHVQQVCSNCGYHVFSHTVKAHDGESLTSSEMDNFVDQNRPHCPICESQGCSLSQLWVTGSRGYSPEPYPIPVEDEFCVE
ncbi:PAS domain S-box diguanylate cyclase (GGDEF) domain-containing protein, putative [Babesia ovata]|uniref:PAS domain S-box diguanylate cyclase (GGDEF) domain-containing protein, putative n=1 Tax=Babesia ovata TaxID=189622 RepID=A0A2H6KHC5_9APIC|nr:PAS domain S-box diguanylate cyclase (GGDEF) domain-containing protein, putative [Babesia ovata]GBE62392.1 PAS domain S-box diguanylate cyclase (GGDEF) domain-containing protein, putative [Babesia ovata]